MLHREWPRTARRGSSAVAAVFIAAMAAVLGAAPPATAAPRPTVWATTDGRVVEPTGTDVDVRFDGTVGAHLRIECARTGDKHPWFRLVTPSGGRLDGTFRCSWTRNSWAALADLPALPETGIYTLNVSYPSEFAVALRLNVIADEVVQPAADGREQTVYPTTPHGNVAFTFHGEAGERIYVSCMTYATKIVMGGEISAVKPVLVGPNNKVIPESGQDTRNCFPAVRDVVRSNVADLALPASGTYRLVLDYSEVFRRTDSTMIRLSRPPADVTGELALGGQPLSMRTTADGQNARATFTLADGERGLLACYDGQSSWVNTLTSADGKRLTAPKCAWSFEPHGGAPVTVTGPGTFTVVVDPGGFGSNDVHLRLFRVPDDATAAVPVGGEPVSLSLSPGQKGRFTLAVGEDTGPLTLHCRQAQYPSSTARLLGPNGAEIDNDSCYTFDGDTFPARRFTTAGTYTLVVEPWSDVAPTVTVWATLDPAPAASTR